MKSGFVAFTGRRPARIAGLAVKDVFGKRVKQGTWYRQLGQLEHLVSTVSIITVGFSIRRGDLVYDANGMHHVRLTKTPPSLKT